jgi:hypothetical protein
MSELVMRGFYKHYKGDPYFVLGVGVLHDESRRIVVYHSIESAIEEGGIRLRYEDDFAAWINRRTHLPVYRDRDQEYDMGNIPRFERIEPRQR